MRPLILCLERLDRFRHVLGRRGGAASIRDLWRSDGIRTWEIEQAANLGWLTIHTRKPRTGRPSRVVEFCGQENAKVPPPRLSIEREISIRHWWFALRSVTQSVKNGMPHYGLPGIVAAYVATYRPQSRHGAYASTSRLLKRPDVRAARQWFYARSGGELSHDERMPDTASGIRKRLREIGSWRADHC